MPVRRSISLTGFDDNLPSRFSTLATDAAYVVTPIPPFAGAASAPMARTAVSAAQRWSMLVGMPTDVHVHASWGPGRAPRRDMWPRRAPVVWSAGRRRVRYGREGNRVRLPWSQGTTGCAV